MKFYKYQGAGNDFLIADNRDGALTLSSEQVASLCDRRYGVGADGLMLLEGSDRYDFRMTYFNSDGSGGMMCGNGGRCIVAFAADMGMTHFDFEAADGFHTAEIVEAVDNVRTVRLKMKDIASAEKFESLTGVEAPSEGYFLETGTRHYVRFVSDVGVYPVVAEGRDIRYNAAELQPIGANVNFVEQKAGTLHVRTYEKGVEDETYACGTGIVASCLAAYVAGIKPSSVSSDGRFSYEVKAKRDLLSVDFVPGTGDVLVHDVWLTGPATFVAEININTI